MAQFVAESASKTEEAVLKKVATEVHISRILTEANTITNHFIVKIKQLDDGSKNFNGRIALHCNKYNEKLGFEIDSSVCPPIDIWLFLSPLVIFQWLLVKFNAKTTFIKSAKAERDLFVILPKTCRMQTFY